MKNGFNLSVRDVEDLSIMSAALQDAVVRVGDLTYLPKRRRFAGVVNRFMWESQGEERQPESKDTSKQSTRYSRTRTGFHFDGVEAVRTQNILQDRKDGILEMLAIRFNGDDDGKGRVELIFSGGGTIVLQVECLEASFQDLGQAWPTPNLPIHGVSDDPDQ